ncbi:OLC1v1000486C1 [Oldenlandia corymbosa var. corymbosa]|uniref:OLC1v1000486C1 n=1 Tax=Oldenlandia corymbosa var. corymbosa TaxID=529605 RepID=A0AAV1D3D6_OLDCO|nr:OLC1v1000486C1 [Oldenlandia corymbosa var. corymbosa]
MSSEQCKGCRRRTIVEDFETGKFVCTSCGVVQDFVNFEAQLADINGPIGTQIRLGTAGSGTVYSYKETKIYLAQKSIEDLMLKLGLSSRCDDVRTMVERVTDGEYGSGRWFPIFVGACAYIVMRKDKKPLSVVEVADLVGCDSNEMGRMINRVVDFLDLKLPEFDIISSFERAVKHSPSFVGLSEDLVGVMLKQGVFLIQCSMKWYLTTGRRPMPIVAAVLVFVAELNGVKVKIEEIASELHVAFRTLKKRYSELLHRLVKVAQAALPWGKDITVKNILKNAPFVIQYMELKSTSRRKQMSSFEDARFDLDDLIDDCLKKESSYGYDDSSNAGEHKLKYFEVAEYPSTVSVDRPDEVQISQKKLSTIYSKLLDECCLVRCSAAKKRKDDNRQMHNISSDYIRDCREWWTGKSEMSRKLLLKQIEEKDVGLNAEAPSFDRGLLACQKRRAKISAAKLRIQKIMHPSEVGLDAENSSVFPQSESPDGKKRKKHCGTGTDWEDFVIETLLLHQVKEEEIEKGHYNALLDLHVFNHLEGNPKALTIKH